MPSSSLADSPLTAPDNNWTTSFFRRCSQGDGTSSPNHLNSSVRLHVSFGSRRQQHALVYSNPISSSILFPRWVCFHTRFSSSSLCGSRAHTIDANNEPIPLFPDLHVVTHLLIFGSKTRPMERTTRYLCKLGRTPSAHHPGERRK